MPTTDDLANAPSPSSSPPPPSLRERRRAAATQEILDAAESHITEHGPAALSLRAVARSLGMTVQALYHYFPSRDALVTAVIAAAYEQVADAVADAARAAADPATPGLVAAAEGYRHWAITHPELFQLLYGTPLRHYEAPPGGPTTDAVRRMSGIFEHELFAGFTQAQLAAIDIPPLSPPLRAHLHYLSPMGGDALPPPAVALLLSAWGHMHGLVVLEVFGHTDFVAEHQAEIFHMSMRNMLTDIHGRIPAAGDAV